MKFNVYLNKDDYKAFRRYCSNRFLHTPWLILIMIVVLEALTWHGHKPDTALSAKIISALVIPIVFAVFFCILIAFKWILAKLTKSTFQKPIGLHEFEITESVFREKNEFGSTETNLSRIKMIGQTENHVFVILSNGLGHIIPKREITSVVLAQVLEQLNKTAQSIPPPLPRAPVENASDK